VNKLQQFQRKQRRSLNSGQIPRMPLSTSFTRS
jgi:hypothetical protein